DADRCGVIIKVPEDQKVFYQNKDFMLLPADEMWALILWFRLNFDDSIKKNLSFIVQSHTTTDSIVRLALKYNLGVIKSWVGFAALSAGVRDAWEKRLVKGLKEGKKEKNDKLCDPFILETYGMENGKRNYNIAAMEQSNGFSILGYPPKDKFSLGVKGHVRDKDGVFAALLIAEIAAWAKKNKTSLLELLNKYIYADQKVGIFVNRYEPDPLDGEYPGIEGDRLKKMILQRSLDLYQKSQKGKVKIADSPVTSAVIYRTGKYDRIYPPSKNFQFPDEGIRFYFSQDRWNYLIIRPSGTGNSLRFHVQLYAGKVNKNDIEREKSELKLKAKRIIDDIRKIVGAPRNSQIIY
ncbi:MAG TPA: hypothetical protein P5267_03645, partial [Patescibacteria group bacterium]|nr:hypothetical protein [Patescibacteria group bacterium]